MTTSNDIPLTVLVPDEPGYHVTIFDSTIALKMAVVDRRDTKGLGEEWDRPGLYVLLDPIQSDGSWGCYVGKAPAGIRSRLLSHLAQKDHWYRALLVLRDTTHGFNSAQAAWLEGRVYEILDVAERAILHNKQQPGDNTLPPYERAALEACAISMSRVLRLLGHDPAAPGEVPTIPSKLKGFTNHGVSLSDLVSEGFLGAHAHLVSVNSAWPASADMGPGGTVLYDGKTYLTPSAAASAVRGGAATNGWAYWAVEDDGKRTTLATLRKRYQDSLAGSPLPSV